MVNGHMSPMTVCVEHVSSKKYKPEEPHLALWVLFPGKLSPPAHLISENRLSSNKQSQGILFFRTPMKCSKHKALLCNGFTRAVLSIIVSVVWTWLTKVSIIKGTCQNSKQKKVFK